MVLVGWVVLVASCCRPGAVLAVYLLLDVGPGAWRVCVCMRACVCVHIWVWVCIGC